METANEHEITEETSDEWENTREDSNPVITVFKFNANYITISNSIQYLNSNVNPI